MASRVLVVDDDRALQLLLNVILTRAGFEVEFAGDGREALQKLRNGDGDGYAAVMLDLILPEVSGIDILANLQRDQPSLLKRVIILTSASRGVIDRVDASRVHSLIRKPFDIQDVIRLTVACAQQT
jgi:DNA-binding response OmpR family regulator